MISLRTRAVTAELLDVVEADQAAHRVADDVDPLRWGLREDPLDLAVDQERGAPDVADVERAEVERHADEAVLHEPALEHVHRAARAEEAVDDQHRRRLGRELVERRVAPDPVAAHEWRR